jgi:4-amino-4-deoxy-L-arabinose transferase-like glycosyltransferase
MNRRVRQALLLTAVAGVVLFTRLGAARLWDEDEPIFAGAAREMLERGDWVVPYFNGSPLPDKPALMYWAMMAGYALFGTTEFAARCGSAACGVAIVLLVWQLGRRLFSGRAGFWAGMALATSLNFVLVMRAATPDAYLVLCSTLSLYCFVRGAAPRVPAGAGAPRSQRGAIASGPLSGEPGRGAYTACYAAMALAALAKGPVGIVPPVATIGLFLLISRRPAHAKTPSGKGRLWDAFHTALEIAHPRHVLRTAWSMYPMTGAAVIAAVAGPWYAWVGLRTDGEWLVGFFGVHNLGRFLHPMEHHSGPIFYYPLAIVVGFLPWSAFLWPSLRQAVARARSGRRNGQSYLFLICWASVWLVAFSSARTKLPNYILPMYPAVALLAGAWIHSWLRRPALVRSRDLRGAWLSLGIAGVGLAVAMPIVAAKLLDGDAWLAFTGLPLVAAAVIWRRYALLHRPRAASIALLVAATCWCLSLFSWAAVRIDRLQTSAAFAATVRKHTVGSRPAIRTFGYYRQSLVFYTGRPVRQVFSPDDVVRFFSQRPTDAFVFTSAEHYRELSGKLPADVCVLDRRPWFLRPNEVLLLGRRPMPTRAGGLADASHQRPPQR